MAWTMYAMKVANASAGYHWFDPSSMRFFDSRLGRTVYSAGAGAGQFFVSSERFDYTTPRMYTVRRFDPQTSQVDEAPGHVFQEYASRNGANAAAKRAALAEASSIV